MYSEEIKCISCVANLHLVLAFIALVEKFVQGMRILFLSFYFGENAYSAQFFKNRRVSCVSVLAEYSVVIECEANEVARLSIFLLEFCCSEK